MKKKKILYAEDEKELSGLVTEFLLGEGFDVVAVKNGQEAQEFLGDRPETVDLLLTDFIMPRLDGARLLFWCRENDLHFPVVFMTGSLQRLPDEIKALDDCCASIVMKPFNLNMLITAIETAFEKNHEFFCRGVVASLNSETSFSGKHSLTP